MYRIYKITNKATGEVYIGKTTQTIEERFKKHCASSDCPKLNKAILDYGRLNFEVDILREWDCSEQEANRCESEYIQQYNSIEKGYNSMYSHPDFKNPEGAGNTRKPKVELTEEMSSDRLYLNFETFEEAEQYFKNNKSEILCDKRMFKRRGMNMKGISDSQMNMINLVSIINDWMKPKIKNKIIYQYDIDLVFLKSFKTGDGQYNAAKSLNLNKDVVNTQGFITEVARGRKRIGYGYVWSYLNPYFLHRLINIFVESEQDAAILEED